MSSPESPVAKNPHQNINAAAMARNPIFNHETLRKVGRPVSGKLWPSVPLRRRSKSTQFKTKSTRHNLRSGSWCFTQYSRQSAHKFIKKPRNFPRQCPATIYRGAAQITAAGSEPTPGPPRVGVPDYGRVCRDGGTGIRTITAELAGVIDTWDSLPPDTRTAILAIVEAAQGR